MTAFYSFAVFERPFSEPFRYGHETLTARRGALLRRHDSSGAALCSEASPLSGHSPDRLEEALQALEHLSSEQLENYLCSPEKAAGLPASLRFALEGISAQKELPGNFRPVLSNALLQWRNAEETSGRFLSLHREGYRVFKIKAGDEMLSQLPDFLKNLPKGDWKIRLDGNRALSPAALAQFFREILRLDLGSKIDYLEEPLSAGWQHPLLRESPLSLAADESVTSSQEAMRLLEAPNCPQVFILKPTVLGGLATLSPLAAQLKRAGRRSVYTSTLETEPGRRSLLAHLGREGSGEVHGLSSGYLFRQNLLPDAAVYGEMPAVSPAELTFWQGLDWRGCP